MNTRIRWTLAGLLLLLAAGGGLRAYFSWTAKKAAQAQELAQRVPAGLELASSDLVQVQRMALARGLAISGPVKAVNSAFVKARVAGELQGLTVREGDFVKAGQVLATVESTEFQARVRQAQQQAESAKAQVDIARRSFDNNRSLVEQGFISKTALDASLATLSSAEANYQAAQAGADVVLKSLSDTVLRAPIGGQIAQRLAQPGERVAVDARIVEVVDLSGLELEAALSAGESLDVKVGQTAELTIEGAGKPVRATVVRVNPSAVAGSRAILAYLAVEPLPGLRQGLFAQGTLAIGTRQMLAVPLSAVRTDKPQPYLQLFVDGKVVHQTVVLGDRGEFNAVPMVGVSGVDAGASVLVGSVGALREGTPLRRNQAAH
jgi:RND family efflux transporter MFP subunit